MVWYIFTSAQDVKKSAIGYRCLTIAPVAMTFPGLPWSLVPVLVILAVVIRRKYFTSIRDIPGPWLASISSLWKIQQIIKGHTEEEMLALHRKHGRLNPVMKYSSSDPIMQETLFVLPIMKSALAIQMP
jgi:hypothetical protein